MVKVQEGSNGQKLITLPKHLARAMGWGKGSKLNFEVIDEKSLKIKSD